MCSSATPPFATKNSWNCDELLSHCPLCSSSTSANFPSQDTRHIFKPLAVSTWAIFSAQNKVPGTTLSQHIHMLQHLWNNIRLIGIVVSVCMSTRKHTHLVYHGYATNLTIKVQQIYRQHNDCIAFILRMAELQQQQEHFQHRQQQHHSTHNM